MIHCQVALLAFIYLNRSLLPTHIITFFWELHCLLCELEALHESTELR